MPLSHPSSHPTCFFAQPPPPQHFSPPPCPPCSSYPFLLPCFCPYPHNSLLPLFLHFLLLPVLLEHCALKHMQWHMQNGKLPADQVNNCRLIQDDGIVRRKAQKETNCAVLESLAQDSGHLLQGLLLSLANLAAYRLLPASLPPASLAFQLPSLPNSSAVAAPSGFPLFDSPTHQNICWQEQCPSMHIILPKSFKQLLFLSWNFVVS